MILSLIISILFLTSSTAAAESLPDWGMAIDKAHPRLLMSDAEMKTLRKNIRRNKDVKLLHNSILGHADKCVDDTLQLSYGLDESGTRLLEQSRYALERIFFCAYAWRMTGKDKYHSKVREDINGGSVFCRGHLF